MPIFVGIEFMKRLLLILSVICMVVPNAFSIQTGASTQGSEFYLSFIRAIHNRDKKMYVIVSADEAGVISFKDSRGNSATETFPAGVKRIEMASITKSNSKEDVGEAATTVTGKYPYCYTIDAGVVCQQGYIIETFKSDGVTPLKVSLYAGLTNETNTADFANVFPIDALGTEYFVVSREGSTGNGGSHSEAVIVATEDNTEIEIFPTAIPEVMGSAASLSASKIEVTLNKGETYMLRAYSTSDDMSGSYIRTKKGSSECKKIAVFAGTQHSSPGDFEYDQIFPKHLWGTEYLVVPTEDQSKPLVRIVAGNPCTTVYINGDSITTLNQTEWYEYIDTERLGAYIQTTQPVEVAQFTSIRGSSEDNDASMITLAPVQQMLGGVLFTPEAASYKKVTITTKTSNTSNVTLSEVGGSSLALPWAVMGVNSEYSFATANVNSGVTYNINATKDGFNAVVYGYSPDKYEYGYSAGSAAIVDELSFNLDTIKSDNLSEDVCVGDQVSFKANLPSSFTVDNVEWKIWKAKRNVDGTYVHVPDVNGNDSLVADETQLVKDTVCKKSDYGITYSFPEEMKYVTRMIVTKTATTCYSTTMQDSVTAVYNVRRYYKQEVIDTTVCYNVPITIARRSELSSVPESQMVYRWYEMSGGVPDLSSNPAHDKNTLTEVIAQGTTKRGFVLYTNDVSDPCNVYVDTVLVTVPTAVSVTLNVNGSDELRICNDGSVTATLTATMTPSSAIGEESLSYTWNKPGLSGLTPTPFVPTSSETVTFTATVRNEAGDLCSTAEKSIDIKAFPVFTASLAASSPDYIGADLLPMSGGYVTYTVTTSVGGTYDYVWHPSGPNTGVMSRDVTEEVTYYAEVWDSEHLCTSTTNSITTKLGIVKLQTLVNPLMLSDGFGNKTIDGALLSTLFSNGYKLYVFDRYGKLVSDTKNEGWSSEDMRKADAGVYFYLLEYNKSDGNTEKMRGSIEIIKN